MNIIKRIFTALFLLAGIFAMWQCARRGTPSGGPKDINAPILIKAEPENLTTNFKDKKIRLYFDEYIKLQDIQNQLIVSPPLKYNPEISPQGSASKFVEIVIKDTLKENTTYTFNFGQSIVDNNEGNSNSFLSYVFSTGDYIDSLTLSGVVKDAFNVEPDPSISVLLYEIDTAYTDSTIYKSLPNYITNTQDSTHIFELKNLKSGTYSLVAIKDVGKNNLFDQKDDKIGFVKDTITLPTDSIYLLNIFKEIPDYSAALPNYAASNKIIFGYFGKNEELEITPLSQIPDTVRTLIAKEPEKDSLNFWFTPFTSDSLIFKVENVQAIQIDTFTVKTRKLAADSLRLNPSHRSSINLEEQFYIGANIPLVSLDTNKISLYNKDTLAVNFNAQMDSVWNRVEIIFEKEANEMYQLMLEPGAMIDFFEETNDTLSYRLTTGSYADFGNLRLNLSGNVEYPVIVQLTTEQGDTKREIYAEASELLEFNSLEPSKYLVRLIIDSNQNKEWDTGSYLRKEQPERVIYYPQVLDVRANWELEQTFIVED